MPRFCQDKEPGCTMRLNRPPLAHTRDARMRGISRSPLFRLIAWSQSWWQRAAPPR
jgi:hypothetical protein